VNVRVLLDRHLEKSANTGAYDYLSAHRVHVRWAPAGTTYHQKTLTVDDATSYGCVPWPGSERWRTAVTLMSFSTTRRPIAGVTS